MPQKGASAPLNGTLFGKKVTAEDQVKMRSRGQASSNMTDVLMKREIWMQRQIATQEEGHMKTGFVLLQVKNLLEARRAAWDTPFPSAFRGCTALWTPWVWTCSLHNSKRINSCSKSPLLHRLWKANTVPLSLIVVLFSVMASLMQAC